MSHKLIDFHFSNHQLTQNVFEFMVTLWNGHTEEFQQKLLGCPADTVMAVPSIDKSILSLKGTCRVPLLNLLNVWMYLVRMEDFFYKRTRKRGILVWVARGYRGKS